MSTVRARRNLLEPGLNRQISYAGWKVARRRSGHWLSRQGLDSFIVAIMDYEHEKKYET